MQNLDYWNTFVGDESPESFMRTYGSIDPELCVARFLEERGQFYGIVNRGTWAKTFAMPGQYHCLTVKVYLLSYLEETRDQWLPSLEASPPTIPRRYREKFDQDRFPPPVAVEDDGPADEVGTYGSYVPTSDHDFGDSGTTPHAEGLSGGILNEESGVSFEEFETEQPPPAPEAVGESLEDASDPPIADVVIPETDTVNDEQPPQL
jgi:hypothetical protein